MTGKGRENIIQISEAGRKNDSWMKVKKLLNSSSVDPVQLEVVVREPEMAINAGPVEMVLVHGSCHTAACWQQFQEYFAHAGYRSLAFSLRGHGKSAGHETVLRNRLRDYVADLEYVVNMHVKGPFVLIGHSGGGYIVQSYLHQRKLPRPAAGILLATLTPLQARRWSCDMRIIAKNVGPFLQAYLTGNARALYVTPEETRRWFFTPDTPQTTVDACFCALQDESMKFAADILHLPTPERNHALLPEIPLYFVGAARDATIPPLLFTLSAAAYGAMATIFPDRGHDLMLDTGWAEVAEHIEQWIKNDYVAV